MAREANTDERLNGENGQLPDQQFDQQMSGSPGHRWIKIIGAAGFALTLLIYILRLNRAFGLFVDDAWYVMLAKALATGQGYTLINSPSSGILPLYPPGFPFILSLAYRVMPQFPDNIWLLKSVSIAAMMAAGFLTYRYFAKIRKLSPYLALFIALATMLNTTLVFLATSSLMSECVFLLLFLSAVTVIEGGVRASGDGKALRFVLAGAILSAGAFLMRSVAVSLIVAVFIYLLKERMRRQALIFAAVAISLSAPWMIYSRLHAPTPAQQQEQGGHIVQPYTQQFWQKRAGDTSSGAATMRDIPGRVWENIVEISGRDVARILVAPIFEALINPAKEIQDQDVQVGGKRNTLIFSFILAALIVIGFIVAAFEKVTLAEIAVLVSLGITVLWPWETFRFVLPLAPFLIFYFLASVKFIVRIFQRQGEGSSDRMSGSALSAAAVLLVAVNLYGNVNYLVKSGSESVLEDNPWATIFDEAEEMMRFLDQNAPKDSVISTPNPAFVHLYTGHKTVSSGNAIENWENWKKIGVRYIARVAVFSDAARPEKSGYKIVYRSARNPSCWVVDLGSPLSRTN